MSIAIRTIRIIIGSIFLFLGLPVFAAGVAGLPWAIGFSVVGLFIIFK